MHTDSDNTRSVIHYMAPEGAVLWILLVLGTATGCVGTGGEKSLDRTSRPPVTGKREGAPATPSDGPSAVTNELILRGLAVYREQYCGLCHRLDRAETGGVFGPSHNGFAAIAAQRIQADDYTGRATTAAAYVRESILTPNMYLVPGYEATQFHMPAYKNLTPEDLEALVQLLLSEE
jgi:mono/diheme cytochrome c family protein